MISQLIRKSHWLGLLISLVAAVMLLMSLLGPVAEEPIHLQPTIPPMPDQLSALAARAGQFSDLELNLHQFIEQRAAGPAEAAAPLPIGLGDMLDQVQADLDRYIQAEQPEHEASPMSADTLPANALPDQAAPAPIFTLSDDIPEDQQRLSALLAKIEQLSHPITVPPSGLDALSENQSLRLKSGQARSTSESMQPTWQIAILATESLSIAETVTNALQRSGYRAYTLYNHEGETGTPTSATHRVVVGPDILKHRAELMAEQLQQQLQISARVIRYGPG